jgi:23S rRNA (uracil1939-C5)-methyltransferase
MARKRREPDPATITLGGTAVALPSGAFLQATADGQDALVEARAAGWRACRPWPICFRGWALLPLRWQAHRRTARPPRFWPWRPRDSHLACQAAARMNGRPVHALHRDLFRNPLRAEELNRFAAVLIDPPRAGAREQVAQIAESTVARVVYISCNPASWARDAATMVAAGYRLAGLKAVGQFRWSTHVELASLFVRETAA